MVCERIVGELHPSVQCCDAFMLGGDVSPRTPEIKGGGLPMQKFRAKFVCMTGEPPLLFSQFWGP